jgi:hypothetical protein
MYTIENLFMIFQSKSSNSSLDSPSKKSTINQSKIISKNRSYYAAIIIILDYFNHSFYIQFSIIIYLLHKMCLYNPNIRNC